MDLNITSTLAPVDDSLSNTLIGYGSLLLSCIGFGTMFVPLRNKQCKDGFFVQWIECSVVLFVGYVINCARGFPQFRWQAAIGGALYATGNVFSVPIVEGVGMGLGFLIWSSMQIVVGWGVARFGLGGWVSGTEPLHDWLNYLGLALTLVSGVLFVFVRHQPPGEAGSYDVAVASSSQQELNDSMPSAVIEDDKESVADEKEKKSNFLVKIPFIIMAVGLAICHGLMMTPIDVLKNKYPTDDKWQVFDYHWSFYSTVFAFSTLYFFSYVVIMPIFGRKPHIKAELALPSFIYGALWTTGMTLWFVSSDRLSQVVAYPITTRLPPIISALIDVFVFKSITGTKNLIFLSFAIIVGLGGVVLIALSNQKF